MEKATIPRMMTKTDLPDHLEHGSDNDQLVRI